MSAPLSPTMRRCAAVLAVIGWTALVVQVPFSIERSLAEGRTVPGGVMRYLSFFTIQTNVLVALALVVTWLAPASRLGAFFQRPRVVTALAAYITLVGVAYHVLLSALYNPTGIPWVTDIVFHYVMPAAFLVYWWLVVPPTATLWPGAALAGFPLGYFLYLLGRGALTGDYLYPFVDVTQLGYPRTIANAVGLFVVLYVMSILLASAKRLRAGGGD